MNWIGKGSELTPTLSAAGMTKKHWDLLNEVTIGPDGVPGGSYAKSYNFLMDIRFTPLTSLSKAQRKWIDDIIEQLDGVISAQKEANI